MHIKGGLIIGDVGKHKYIDGSSSEWGKGLNIIASSDVLIEDLCITLCTGDGIYISGNNESAIGEYEFASKNVRLTKVVCDDNRRQGLSIIHVDGLIVRDCSFINTGRTESTAPSAGIDIEPNVTNGRNMSVRNIVIDNCLIKNNKGMAVANSTTFEHEGQVTHENILYSNCITDGLLKCSSDGVNFRNCSFKEARLAGVYTETHICFENCTIAGGYGLYIVTPPTPHKELKDKLLSLSFKGCSLSTAESDTDYNSLISCNTQSGVLNIDSITFDNCRLQIPPAKKNSFTLTNHPFLGKLRIQSSKIFMPGRVFDPKGIDLRGSIIYCRSTSTMSIDSTNLVIKE